MVEDIDEAEADKVIADEVSRLEIGENEMVEDRMEIGEAIGDSRYDFTAVIVDVLAIASEVFKNENPKEKDDSGP